MGCSAIFGTERTVSIKRTSAILLALVILSSLAWVVAPMVILQPFAAQTPRSLVVAYAMRLRSAPLTLGLLILGSAAAVLLRPRLATTGGRAVAATAVVALAGCAFLARSNHFEWMFRPLPRPGFVEAGATKHVAEDDLVLGVEVGTEARAYPVRAMAYHHLVNDVIAGEAVVATY